MKEIILKKIEKKQNIIKYEFEVSKELEKYFSGKPFVIEYSDNVESVPDAVASIPFISNVLPIVWLTDSKLSLKQLDKAFFECIPEVKKGYEEMFPESEFKGRICVEEIVPCVREKTDRKAMFYSGGLDSVQTLISHLDEKPDLIAIWGSDIRFDNKSGWDLVYSAVEEASKKYNLKDVMIHSSFREFDCEGILDREYSKQLKDGWWHGVKHGIGLLGHVAPYAYIHGITTMYIASSHSVGDGKVRCASNPIIDNNMRYVNCQIVHDGFEYTRQDKIHNVVSFCNENSIAINMHVCWESQKGTNCCRCEKCYRTISGIIAELANPEEYGFYDIKNTLSDMQRTVLLGGKLNKQLARTAWYAIHNRILQNKNKLKNTKYWKDIRWIAKSDFMHPETLKMPLKYRFQQRLYSNSLYQFAHEVKVRLKNGKR